MPTDTNNTITGKRNDFLSWEKQTVYDLSNGFQATVSYSHYGDMVSRLDSPDGYVWHCSNGLGKVPDLSNIPELKYITLPAFAHAWIEELKNAHGVFDRIVRPGFLR